MRAKPIYYAISLGILISLFSMCTKDDNEPIQQDILYSDSSEYTGNLAVYCYYDDGTDDYPKADDTNLFLYASYEDMINDINVDTYDFALYRLNTGDNSHIANFGYVLIGNYYVLGFNYINGFYYERTGTVQIRPKQMEELSLTLHIAE